MGDIIAWKVAEEVIEILVSESAMVSGMSISEAATAYGYTLTNSGMYVKTVADIVSFTGTAATAGEAIAGTTATGGATTSVVNLTLYTTAEGTTAVGALGSIALPIAACCLAGAVGFCLGDIIGTTIDKAFPDFFVGMFESISEFVTGDKYGLAYIFTGDGKVYMPSEAKNSVKNYIEAEISTIRVDGTKITYREVQSGDTNFLIYNSGLGGLCLNMNYDYKGDSPIYIFGFVVPKVRAGYIIASKSSFTFRTMYKILDEETGENIGSRAGSKHSVSKAGSYGVYSTEGTCSIDWLEKFSDKINIPIIELTESEYINNMARIINVILGISTESSSGYIPEITPYEVPEIPTITTPTEMPDWSIVELPSTGPKEVPTEFPTIDPDAEPNPQKITPYLPQPAPYPESVPLPEPVPKPNPNPIVVPNPIPVPVPNPVPSPEIDPSVEPSPKPSVTPVPTPPPPDTGETPVPPLPIIPPISSQSAGLLHVYNPTTDEINEFGKWLWTTFSGDLIDTIGKLFNNPMDAVIGLHELYCTPITGDVTTIRAGFLDSDVTSRLVSKRYVEINCNAIAIPEYWGNYLDYAPYTKVHCYLPFIGIVELNPNDIIGHGVQVVYKVDTYNGSCIAMIITAKNSSESVKYQFSGNCAVEVPITSGMKSALQSALIGAGTCAIGAVAGGVVAGATVSSGVVGASAARGASQRGLNSSNSVSHSGSFGSSFGAMGIKKPYFIVERPVQKVVPNYNEKYGYPAHKMVTIGNCSGYLRCRDFEFKSSTATEEEKKLIEELLQKGVYV